MPAGPSSVGLRPPCNGPVLALAGGFELDELCELDRFFDMVLVYLKGAAGPKRVSEVIGGRYTVDGPSWRQGIPLVKAAPPGPALSVRSVRTPS